VKSEIGNSIKFRAVGFFATLYFGEPITLISFAFAQDDK
jgi:hypothetical protein